MLEVRVVLTDEEAKQAKKNKGEQSWRDYIINGRTPNNSKQKRKA